MPTQEIGLIPASAGQTSRKPQAREFRRAHPRECGADHLQLQLLACDRGSSPRVRGRQLPNPTRGSTQRLIPASAGQTFANGAAVVRSTAHPRECGADVAPRVCRWTRLGSSPRVRGRPFATSNAAPIERVKEPTSSSHLLRYPANAGNVVAALSLRLIPAQQGHTRILVHLLLIHISLDPISERWAFGIQIPQTSATLSN